MTGTNGVDAGGSAFGELLPRDTLPRASYLGKRRAAPPLIPLSRSYRVGTQFQQFPLRMDRTEVLGGYCTVGEGTTDRSSKLVGHRGCVNTLAWSPDGETLASGSDDKRIILWKLGGKDHFLSADQDYDVPTLKNGRPRRRERRHEYDDLDDSMFASFNEGHDPPQAAKLDMGMEHVIETGHRANIFSVKFAPTRPSRLFSAAGDAQVRVFDLERGMASASTRRIGNREYTLWNEGGGDEGDCVTRVFRCHQSRAKRIATEQSPDTFLSAGEDGTVRQMDLRVPHTCTPRRFFGRGAADDDHSVGCPRPLCQYDHMELYTLSVSKLEPHLFVVAGTSEYAYLHDRRMVRSLMARDWGGPPEAYAPDGAMTQVVRRFGLPEFEWVDSNDEFDELDPDAEGGAGGYDSFDDEMGGFDEPRFLKEERREEEYKRKYGDEWRKAKQADDLDRRRRKRIADASRRRAAAKKQSPPHITAAKLGENRSDELLLSYSTWDGKSRIFRYDIKSADVEGSMADTLGIGSSRSSSSGSDRGRSSPHSYLRSSEKSSQRSSPHSSRRSSSEMHRGSSAGSRADTRSQHSVEESGEEASDGGSDEPEDSNAADMDDDDDDDVGDADDDEDDIEADDWDEDEDDEEDDDDDDDFDMPARARSPGPRLRAVPLIRPLRSYFGHRNDQTVKDVNFAGPRDQFVMSGSDDGNLFMWNTDSGRLEGIWKGDSSVVNVMQPHPYLPAIAASGIDNTVKLLTPIGMSEGSRYNLGGYEHEVVRENWKNVGHMQSGYSAPALLQLLREQFMARAGDDDEEDGEGPPPGLRVPVDAEGEDCTVM